MAESDDNITPVMELVMGLLKPTEGDSYELDDAGLAKVEMFLRASSGEEQGQLLLELQHFARFIDAERGCPEASQKLLRLCRKVSTGDDNPGATLDGEPPAVVAMKMDMPTGEAAETRARFANFMDEKDKLLAPKHDEKVPEGAFKVGTLGPTRI